MNYISNYISNYLNSLEMEFAMLIGEIVLFTVFFVFKAIGTYIMAKRAALKNKWMAFIPFLNYVLLGKIVGPVYMFRQKINNLGVIVAPIYFVYSVVSVLYSFGYYVNTLFMLSEIPSDPIFRGPLTFLQDLYLWSFVDTQLSTVLYFVLWAGKWVLIVSKFFLVFVLFRKYAPKQAIVFSILSVFFDFLIGLFIFIIRNNGPVEFRSNVQRAPSGYNNPYQNTNAAQDKSRDINEDPFPEFDGREKTRNNEGYNNVGQNSSTGSKDNTSDDLFD